MDSAKEKNNLIVANFLQKVGFLLLGISLTIFLITFYPVLLEEFKYFFSDSKSKEIVISTDNSVTDFGTSYDTVAPADLEFSIIIPKIEANARIIENVDPYNSAIYQNALTKGVAHAAGTSTPGNGGNTFLFAHSSDNFYNANRYNSVFYLLRKLEFGDKFYIFKEGTTFEYKVKRKDIVDPDAVEYLGSLSGSETATLMTCWPPGTTLQRLIVIGDLINVEY